MEPIITKERMDLTVHAGADGVDPRDVRYIEMMTARLDVEPNHKQHADFTFAIRRSGLLMLTAFLSIDRNGSNYSYYITLYQADDETPHDFARRFREEVREITNSKTDAWWDATITGEQGHLRQWSTDVVCRTITTSLTRYAESIMESR